MKITKDINSPAPIMALLLALLGLCCSPVSPDPPKSTSIKSKRIA